MAKVVHALQNALALIAGGVALALLSPIIALYVLFNLFGVGKKARPS